MEWSTTSTILANLRDFDNNHAWGSFVDRFLPILVAHGRSLGLQSADAEDAAQGALMRFVKAYRDGVYDPSKGSLRNWLFTISQNVVTDTFRAKSRRPEVRAGKRDGDEDGLVEVADPRMRAAFEDLWNREMLTQCLGRARMEFSWSIFQAFILSSMEDKTIDEVAEELGLTRRAVYVARYRVAHRLAELRKSFEEPA